MNQTAFDDPNGIIQNHVLSGRLVCNGEYIYQFGAEGFIPHEFDFTSPYQSYLELDGNLFMKTYKPKSSKKSSSLINVNLALKLNVSPKQISPIFTFLSKILI